MTTLIARDVDWMSKPNSIEEVLTDVSPPHDQCSAAFVFAFDDQGRVMLAHVRKRGGLDIVGGHIDPIPGAPGLREDPATAATREAREETGAVVTDLVQVGYRRLHEPNGQPGGRYPKPYSHMVFYAGRIAEIGPVEATDECGESRLLTHEEALEVPAIRKHLALYEAARAALSLNAAPRFGGR